MIAVLARWQVRRHAKNPDADPWSRANKTIFGIGITIWIRYAVLGLILGGTWIWNEDKPPWLQAVRRPILLMIVGPAIRLARGRWGKHKERVMPGGMVIREWTMMAKLFLVFAAVGLEHVLELWMSAQAAAQIVGLVLGIAVAVVGPLLLEQTIEQRKHRRREGLARPS